MTHPGPPIPQHSSAKVVIPSKVLGGQLIYTLLMHPRATGGIDSATEHHCDSRPDLTHAVALTNYSHEYRS